MRYSCIVGIVLVTVACGSQASGDGGGTDTGAEATTQHASEGSDGSTGAPACNGPVGAGACAGLAICEAYTCGGKSADWDHEGCARVACDGDADCPGQWRCYALALGASCIASQTSCEELAGECACGSTDDCNGILRAYCLPEEFYPSSQDCDVAAFACGERPAWLDAMRSAHAQWAEQGATDLIGDLRACSSDAALGRLDCGDAPCAVLCELADCGAHGDVTSCESACAEAIVDLPPVEVEIVVGEVASAPAGACDCDACDGGSSVCAQLWGCP